MKRMIALLLAMSMVLALTACGKKEETKAPVPGTNAPAEEPKGGCASAFGSALILVVALGAGLLCKK